jgi:hypothetical protein
MDAKKRNHLTPSAIAELRKRAERPYGSQYENPDTLTMLLDEVEWLQGEVARLRRSVE